MTTCVNCSLWEVKEDDHYCSFCGHKFFSLNLSISPSRFQHEDLPPPAALTIENRSTHSTVTITAIGSDASWAIPQLATLSFPLILKPQQKKTIDVDVETLNVDDEYADARIEVVSTAGREGVTIEVLPSPDMNVETGEYEIQLDDRNDEETYATISIESGAVTIKQILAEPEEWASVELPAEITFPLDLAARHRNSLRVRLRLNEKTLRRQSPMLPALHDGTLRIICDAFERIEPFRVKCWKAPELAVWEHGQQSGILLGRPSRITITLQNKDPRDATGGKGNAALLINSIQWQTDAGSPVAWINPVSELSFPIRIDGGVFHRIPFVVHPALGDIGEGRHRLNCLIETNRLDVQTVARYDFNASPIQVYNGVLAIDFGTSNTCCALLHNDVNDHEMVPLEDDGDAQLTTVPTVSLYQAEQPDGSRRLRIGTYADQLVAIPAVVQSTVRSLKRELGRSKREYSHVVRFRETQEYTELSATEVVADFLGQVRLRAEDKARATLSEFIVTHPARFRTKQVKALRQAVRTAFGEHSNIKTLQEPVAAALDFIVSDEATKSDQYVLGVFDLGGGTTDLSLLKVRNQRIDNVLSIDVEVVASAGKWFGGENLTEFIAHKAADRAQQVLPKMTDVVQPAELLVDERSSTDQSMSLMARTNRLRLWQWSDLVKPALFQNASTLSLEDLPNRPDLFPELTLHAYSPAGAVEVKFPFDILKPDANAVFAYLDSGLRMICAMLVNLVNTSGLPKLDRVLLSGKTTVIPRVKAVVQEEFPEAQIVRAKEPKECVVRGACLLRKLDHASDVVLTITGGTTTLSRLGISGNAEGHKAFKQYIAAGVPIPTGGLSSTQTHVFDIKPIEVLENDSDEDWLTRMKEKNPSIEVMGVYELENPPPEISGGARRLGRLEMRVSEDHAVELTGRIEGIDEVLRYRRRPENDAA